MDDPRNPLNIQIPGSSTEIAERIGQLSLRHPIINAVLKWETMTRAERAAIIPPTQAAMATVLAEQLARQVERLDNALQQLTMRTMVPFAFLSTGDLSQPLAQLQVIGIFVQVPHDEGRSTRVLPSWTATCWIDPRNDPDGAICHGTLRLMYTACGPAIEALKQGDEATAIQMGPAMLAAGAAHLKAQGFTVAAFIGQQTGNPIDPATAPDLPAPDAQPDAQPDAPAGTPPGSRRLIH